MVDRVEAPAWRPSQERIDRSNVTAFLAEVRDRWGVTCSGYDDLWRWSIADPARFWTSIWDVCEVRAESRGEIVLEGADQMPGAVWFPHARLSFTENLLRRHDDGPAIIYRREDGLRRSLSWSDLHESVSRLSSALHAWGIGPGDRLAAWLPNVPEAVIALLAGARLGAVFSSCSPDFGADGVIDRFGQIGPRVLFTTQDYLWRGRAHDLRPRLREVTARLPGLERIVLVPSLDCGSTFDDPRTTGWPELLAAQPDESPESVRLPFAAPLYILYSSGTTGRPKCIVHGAGGTLLQHLKEHRLHADIRSGDRVFYHTTLGWMMWNWLVSALASEATVLLWDGSPLHPEATALFDFAQSEGMTHFGTSARYLDTVRQAGLDPLRTHDLSSLRVMLSTGSPLGAESFDWVYAHVKRDICLASISGGTDIVSCFVGGNPIGPVWSGEIQAAGLGMAVEIFDEQGRPLDRGVGELVCTRPFPSMPVGFWSDPDGQRYRAAYFERFPGVWHHGDLAERTKHGGYVIHGRSDAVLNPGGVRIGTAEIYRPLEGMAEIAEALAVGPSIDGEVRIWLLVELRPGHAMDALLERQIRERIRAAASPRHVPERIFAVPDLPRTRSGKLVELAVRDLLEGRPPSNASTLANPEALETIRKICLA